MPIKERVGLIVETRQGVLLVKEKRDIHLKKDKKFLRNAYFHLSDELSNTEFSRKSQEAVSVIAYLGNQQDLTAERFKEQLEQLQKIITKLKHLLVKFDADIQQAIEYDIGAVNINQVQDLCNISNENLQMFQSLDFDMEKLEKIGSEMEEKILLLQKLLRQNSYKVRTFRDIKSLLYREFTRYRIDQIIEDGKYSTPGGHIRRHETIADAAERELREETNLKLKSLMYFGQYKGSNRNHNLVIVKAEGQLEIEDGISSGIGFLEHDSPLVFTPKVSNKIGRIIGATQGHVIRLLGEYIDSSFRAELLKKDWISDISVRSNLIKDWYSIKNIACKVNGTESSPNAVPSQPGFIILPETAPVNRLNEVCKDYKDFSKPRPFHHGPRSLHIPRFKRVV